MPTANIEDRFFAKVNPHGVCWEWTASLSVDGYARFSVVDKTVYAHRWIWERLVGPIPDGHQIDHLCKNRRCVNPDHLEPVTRKANILRSGATGAMNARKTHCAKGHTLELIAVNARGCKRCISEKRKIRRNRQL